MAITSPGKPVKINTRHEVTADLDSQCEVECLVTDVRTGKSLSRKLSVDDYFRVLDFLSFHNSDNSISMLEVCFPEKKEVAHAATI